MAEKSPAFSFYPTDFMAGTLTFTLEERGAYVTLLCHQWGSLFVPGDNLKALGRILGTSPTETRKLWSVIAPKFDRGNDGCWRNTRLEKERVKQANRRNALAENGAKGAEERWRGHSKQIAKDIAEPMATPLATPMANGSQSDGLSFSSSSSERAKANNTPSARATGVQGRGAFEANALPRDHMKHALCGPRLRLCLSYAEFGKLKAKYGGTDNEARAALEDFVAQLEAAVGDGGIGDHLWLLNHFEVFMAAHARVEPAPQSPHRSKPDQFEGMKDFVRNG